MCSWPTSQPLSSARPQLWCFLKPLCFCLYFSLPGWPSLASPPETYSSLEPRWFVTSSVTPSPTPTLTLGWMFPSLDHSRLFYCLSTSRAFWGLSSLLGPLPAWYMVAPQMIAELLKKTSCHLRHWQNYSFVAQNFRTKVLARLLSWLEHHPLYLKVAGLIPGPDAHQGCGFGSRWRSTGEATN